MATSPLYLVVPGQGLSIGKQLLQAGYRGMRAGEDSPAGDRRDAGRGARHRELPEHQGVAPADLDRGRRDQLIVLRGAALRERRDRGGHGPGLELQPYSAAGSKLLQFLPERRNARLEGDE